jgi:hypothetical protein
MRWKSRPGRSEGDHVGPTPVHVDQRTQWTQRIHAELFQHGLPVPDGEIAAPATKAALCARRWS